MAEMYGDTRLGRQELDGILFDDPEGALWTREMLEAGRAERGESRFQAPGGRLASRCFGKRPSPSRAACVVGVDPPASATGDACGIVVCGLGADGIACVLADLTVAGLSPRRLGPPGRRRRRAMGRAAASSPRRTRAAT